MLVLTSVRSENVCVGSHDLCTGLVLWSSKTYDKTHCFCVKKLM